MSSYLHIYVKNPRNGIFTNLGTFCRSTKMYSAFSKEGIEGQRIHIEGSNKFDWVNRPVKVTREALTNIHNDIQAEIDNCKELIKSNQDTINLILTASNSLDEKMERIGDIQEYILEIKEELSGFEVVDGYLNFLSEIIEEYRYGHNQTFDLNDIIYAGIDCWIEDEDSEI